MNRTKKNVMVSLSNWVVEDILRDVPNKSNYIEEALIKLHMNNQKLNKEATESDNATHREHNGFFDNSSLIYSDVRGLEI